MGPGAGPGVDWARLSRLEDAQALGGRGHRIALWLPCAPARGGVSWAAMGPLRSLPTSVGITSLTNMPTHEPTEHLREAF